VSEIRTIGAGWSVVDRVRKPADVAAWVGTHSKSAWCLYISAVKGDPGGAVTVTCGGGGGGGSGLSPPSPVPT